VLLLCDGLARLQHAQQQQQQQKHSSRGVAPGVLSPVALQLLLESAVQASCLAGTPEAERISLQVSGRGGGRCVTHALPASRLSASQGPVRPRHARCTPPCWAARTLAAVAACATGGRRQAAARLVGGAQQA
jgi:hypothetical protein